MAAWRNSFGFFGLGSLYKDKAVHYVLKLQQGRLDREALKPEPATLDERIPPLDLVGGVIRIPKDERTVAALVRLLTEEWPTASVYVPGKDGTWGDDERTYTSRGAARLAQRITEAFEIGKES